jgi:glycosyltransferase involved in cell wall biosynthesis
MKILHFINNLGSGGAEKLLTDILPLMKNEGNEVYIMVCNHAKSLGIFKDKFAKAGIPIIELGYSFYNPFQIFKLIKVVKQNQFDLIHAHIFPSQYWLAFSSLFFPKKIKLVKTEHSVFNKRQNIGIFQFIETFVYNRYSKIIAISETVKRKLPEKFLSRGKITIINNGVNLEEIEGERVVGCRTDYLFLKDDKFNILMVGRFEADGSKDHPTLIKAISLLDEDVHLFFAGEGPNLQNIKSVADELNVQHKVTFLGVRNDIYRLMSRVDLNVLCTNFEGLSGVTLESLASGKPFLGSDVPGVHEIVPDNRFLFPKQNPVALAEKIESLKQNDLLRKEMAEKSLKFIQKFHINNMVQQYLQVYKEVTN